MSLFVSENAARELFHRGRIGSVGRSAATATNDQNEVASSVVVIPRDATKESQQ